MNLLQGWLELEARLEQKTESCSHGVGVHLSLLAHCLEHTPTTIQPCSPFTAGRVPDTFRFIRGNVGIAEKQVATRAELCQAGIAIWLSGAIMSATVTGSYGSLPQACLAAPWLGSCAQEGY